MPPHRGHLHLIEEARRRVDQLIVLVCSLRTEPIPGEQRFLWMQTLFPDLAIRHHSDDIPQEPREHPDFWNLWTQAIHRFCPERIDTLFTSESYGGRLAECLGAGHVCVDPERTRFPVSGTDIRRDPIQHWEYIPELVRPYFVKKVVIIGAESTGKTTLARELARHYQTVWLPEYGREYIHRKQAPPESADIPLIAQGHLAGEDRLTQAADRLLICDTDLIVTVILSEYFFGACPAEVRRLSFERAYDLYLLTEPDIPWEPDPFQREGPEVRERLHHRIRDELIARKLPFVQVSGSVEERMKTAVAAITARTGLERWKRA